MGKAGVRGIFNRTQTPDQVYGLAETIAFVPGRAAYGVGWDGRKVSSLLARTVISAVNAVGSDVFALGVVLLACRGISRTLEHRGME